MKISNSKKQLAKIIHENGGWREGMLFSWYGNKTKMGYFGAMQPRFDKASGSMFVYGVLGADVVLFECEKVSNWHQTILSRDEYFHLYPVVAAAPETAPEPVVETKPTIEQLAADYRNAKNYAERKQQEADDAKADANEKLRVLELAGEAHGLLVTPITAKQEPEMVIAVQVGDEVECIKSNVNPGKYMGRIGTVSSVDVDDTSTPYLVDFGGAGKVWCHEVKFIRRP